MLLDWESYNECGIHIFILSLLTTEMVWNDNDPHMEEVRKVCFSTLVLALISLQQILWLSGF